MKGSSFNLDQVNLLYCKCHKINPNHRGSYIDSPNWIQNKKATINTINKSDDKCCQHTATLALNHEEIERDSGRITRCVVRNF